MNIRITPEIYYPESDGKPMAETPTHMLVMWNLIQTLIAWFDSPRVYVWGNMFLYYVEGDPTENVSPDVMVIKDVDRDRHRDVFKVWEEGHAPCAVIEVTSRKTRKEDIDKKFRLYRDVLKVREYFLFDPQVRRLHYLRPPLQGFRLVRGVYQPIKPVADRLPSKELGLHLVQQGQELRLWDPVRKTILLTKDERLRQAEEATIRVNEEARRAVAEARRAVAEAARASREVEAENERLRREIAALRRRQPE
jgi:Uma2 family endonuclease